MFIYHRIKSAKKKKKSKDKGKGFASTFLSVNAASPNLSMTTFHFCTFFFAGWGGSLTEIHNSCSPLKRLDHWHYVQRGFVQLQWVIFVRLCYPHLLHALWCNAIPEFTDLIFFPIWCLLSNSSFDELLITRLWRKFPIWPTALLSSSRRNGVLRRWSLLLLFLIQSHKFAKWKESRGASTDSVGSINQQNLQRRRADGENKKKKVLPSQFLAD